METLPAHPKPAAAPPPWASVSCRQRGRVTGPASPGKPGMAAGARGTENAGLRHLPSLKSYDDKSKWCRQGPLHLTRLEANTRPPHTGRATPPLGHPSSPRSLDWQEALLRPCRLRAVSP